MSYVTSLLLASSFLVPVQRTAFLDYTLLLLFTVNLNRVPKENKNPIKNQFKKVWVVLK